MIYYFGVSTEIAFTGHTVVQEPQFIHFAESICTLLSIGEIADTGQIPIQVLHPIHLFESILYAIIFLLFLFLMFNKDKIYWNIAIKENKRCTPNIAN